MSRLAISLLRWACDPEKLEVLEGDFLEIHGARNGWRAWHDAISIALLHSRRLGRIGLLASAAAIALLAADPRHVPTAPARWTVNASDPAGRFTLSFEHQRVVAATIDDEPVDASRLVQTGASLVIKGGDSGRDFSVSVDASGGISWTARRP